METQAESFKCSGEIARVPTSHPHFREQEGCISGQARACLPARLLTCSAFSPQRKGETDGKSFLRTTKLIIWPFVLGGGTTVLQGTRVKSQGFDLDCGKEPSSVTAAAAWWCHRPRARYPSRTDKGMSRCSVTALSLAPCSTAGTKGF